jgi:Putative DNA-binding domain
MKRLKPTNSATNTSPQRPRKVNSRAELRELQRVMATALFRPLTPRCGMQKRWVDGGDMGEWAGGFIKPNDRLSSFERLEIYNRQYWFRVLDCLQEDYPGLRAVVGERKFLNLATAYLERCPSISYSLRDLGSRLEAFLRAEPQWVAPRPQLALDMVRFEWAQVVAFDGPAKPVISPDEVLDASPGGLRLGLQPYLSLLDLNHAVDDFLLALKTHESDGLRREASNAFDSGPKAAPGRRAVRLPKPQQVYLAVHRYRNELYYKRLDPDGYAILSALGRGTPLEAACAEAVEVSRKSGVDWPAQVKEWFDAWSVLGWFCHPS